MLKSSLRRLGFEKIEGKNSKQMKGLYSEKKKKTKYYKKISTKVEEETRGERRSVGEGRKIDYGPFTIQMQ